MDEPPIPRTGLTLNEGEFVLGPLLGAGSTADVYEAWQESLQRWVAVKWYRCDRAPDVVERCAEHEAEVLGRLAHPRIPYLVRHGRQGLGRETRIYLVLERVVGRPVLEVVDSWKDRDARGRAESVAKWMLEAAEAVEHAHQRGILHGDLRPGHLLVTENGVKVLDFGFAELVPEGPTTTPSTALPANDAHARRATSFAYSAPECFSRSDLVRHVGEDVFSLGAIAYRLLAGRTVFEAGERTASEAYAARSRGVEAPPLRRLVPGIPDDLAAIVHQAVANDPRHRYSDASTLVRDLRAFLDGRPVQARSIGRTARARQWVRHHPGQFAALAISIGAVLSTSSGLVLAASRNADRAEKIGAASGSLHRIGGATSFPGFRSWDFASVSADPGSVLPETLAGMIATESRAAVLHSRTGDDASQAWRVPLAELVLKETRAQIEAGARTEPYASRSLALAALDLVLAREGLRIHDLPEDTERSHSGRSSGPELRTCLEALDRCRAPLRESVATSTGPALFESLAHQYALVAALIPYLELEGSGRSATEVSGDLAASQDSERSWCDLSAHGLENALELMEHESPEAEAGPGLGTLLFVLRAGFTAGRQWSAAPAEAIAPTLVDVLARYRARFSALRQAHAPAAVPTNSAEWARLDEWNLALEALVDERRARGDATEEERHLLVEWCKIQCDDPLRGRTAGRRLLVEALAEGEVEWRCGRFEGARRCAEDAFEYAFRYGVPRSTGRSRDSIFRRVLEIADLLARASRGQGESLPEHAEILLELLEEPTAPLRPRSLQAWLQLARAQASFGRTEAVILSSLRAGLAQIEEEDSSDRRASILQDWWRDTQQESDLDAARDCVLAEIERLERISVAPGEERPPAAETSSTAGSSHR